MAEVILVARGEQPSAWREMKALVKRDALRVKAIKSASSRNIREAIGHGERSAKGALVVALDSDSGVQLNDIRRMLSGFDSRFQVIIGRLSPCRTFLGRRLTSFSRVFFGKDSWDSVGIWGYRRSFLPKGLMYGDAYRTIASPNSNYLKYMGEVDLFAKEHPFGVGLELSEILNLRAMKSRGGEMLVPKSGGACFLWILGGMAVLLYGATLSEEIPARVVGLIGVLGMAAGIVASACRTLRKPVQQGTPIGDRGLATAYPPRAQG